MIYELKVNLRKKSEKSKFGENIVGIIYGPEIKENIAISVGFNEFNKMYDEAGESSLINLTVGDEKNAREVLVKEVDYDPVKDVIRHVDFYQIKKGQKLELAIELVFAGEAPVVKESGAILVKNKDKVNVRCLPKDIISKIEVDLSVLKAFDDKITLKDLKFPETIEVLDELEEVVAIAVKPAEEKEEAAPVQKEPELVGKEEKAAEEAGAAEEETKEQAPEKKAEKK